MTGFGACIRRFALAGFSDRNLHSFAQRRCDVIGSDGVFQALERIAIPVLRPQSDQDANFRHLALQTAKQGAQANGSGATADVGHTHQTNSAVLDQ